jgi:hypothetical protein
MASHLCLKPWVDLPGAAAFGKIARNVYKFARAAAFRAGDRRYSSGDEKSALAAFPEGQPTVRTDIADKFIFRRVATVRARPFFLFGFH